jgi:hypothetical protein
MIFDCPVCNKRMISVVNKNIHECPDIKVFVPELNETISANHAIYILNKEQLSTATINVLPYQIHTNYESGTTSIYKLIIAKSFAKIKQKKRYEFKPLLTIDMITVFPWNNRDKLIEKIKLLLLLS